MPDLRERLPRMSAFVSAVQASRLSQRSTVLFSYGFRPFFIGASVWAIASLAPWTPVVNERWGPAGYGPVTWHAHETLFGFGAAAMAGFLLTAIPNWTGGRPFAGVWLAGLFTLWCAGRLAFLAPDRLGLAVTAMIDGAFAPVLFVVATRDVVAARNWRNLKTIALVGLFAGANAGFHLAIITDGAPEQAIRLGTAALIGLIMLIGGRMAPSFTRAWLLARGTQRLPPPFDAVDQAALVVSAAALCFWVARPDLGATVLLLALAGLVQLVRFRRWMWMSTWREPLIFILHVGYCAIPVGFLLMSAASASHVIAPAGALHAWMTGALGVMTLGVMTRAARGHTGRPLAASSITTVSYAAALLAALLRIIAAIIQDARTELLAAAALCWVAAFALFLFEHAVMLILDPP